MNVPQKPKSTWLSNVGRILLSLPAVMGTVYFIDNIIRAVSSAMFRDGSEKFDMGSLSVFLGGILLTAIISDVKKFIGEIGAHYVDSSERDNSTVTPIIHKTLYVVKLVFVATFAAFFSLGALLFSIIAADGTKVNVRAAMIASGVGACAACYGYLLYGILSLQKKYRQRNIIKLIFTIIFVIAWIIFGIIMGYSTIEETMVRPSYAQIIYSDSEKFAIFLFIFGPLVYLAQKYLLHLILVLLNKKWKSKK